MSSLLHRAYSLYAHLKTDINSVTRETSGTCSCDEATRQRPTELREHVPSDHPVRTASPSWGLKGEGLLR